MVPKAGLEPARLAPPPPQDGVSTSSTTSASKTACTVIWNGYLRFYPFIYLFYFRKILVQLNISPAPPIESDRDYNSTVTGSDTSRPASRLSQEGILQVDLFRY